MTDSYHQNHEPRHDRLDPPLDFSDDEALREYGRQLAIDSLIRDAIRPEEKADEGGAAGSRLLAFPSRARGMLPASVAIAACLAGILGLSLWKMTRQIPPAAVATLDPSWSIVAAAGTDYRVLAADRVRLTRGELRFASSQATRLVVETPHAVATAEGSRFLIGHHFEAESKLIQPNPNQTKT